LDHQSTEIKKLDAQTVLELEAAAFRRLVAHLDENKDVQNIDLMNLASFCRNCLSKWYKSAAEDKGIALELENVFMAFPMPTGKSNTRAKRQLNNLKLLMKNTLSTELISKDF